MKARTKLIPLALAATLAVTPLASAAGGNNVSKASKPVLVGAVTTQQAGKEIRVYVDGKQVAFPDQKPYIDKANRTLVPVRFVSESLGAKVDWNENVRQVDISHSPHFVNLQIGKPEYMVSSAVFIMDTVPVITNARTMVPVRFVSEALEAPVDYDEVKGTKTIGMVFSFTQGQTKEQQKATIEAVKKQVQQEVTPQTKPSQPTISADELFDKSLEAAKVANDNGTASDLLPASPATQPAVNALADSIKISGNKVTGKVPEIPAGYTWALEYNDGGTRDNYRNFNDLKSGQAFEATFSSKGGYVIFTIYKNQVEGVNGVRVDIPSLAKTWEAKR